jgi:hypothetical protein
VLVRGKKQKLISVPRQPLCSFLFALCYLFPVIFSLGLRLPEQALFGV